MEEHPFGDGLALVMTNDVEDYIGRAILDGGEGHLIRPAKLSDGSVGWSLDSTSEFKVAFDDTHAELADGEIIDFKDFAYFVQRVASRTPLPPGVLLRTTR